MNVSRDALDCLSRHTGGGLCMYQSCNLDRIETLMVMDKLQGFLNALDWAV